MAFQETASKSLLTEFAYLMTGKVLGTGISREVYDHPSDPTKVIKVENSATEFQNVIEWHFWNSWKHDKDVIKWLAPCHEISYNGTFLVQAKTQPLLKAPDILMPSFLTDHKLANYGLLKGKVVCHDYGRIITYLPMKFRKWKGDR